MSVDTPKGGIRLGILQAYFLVPILKHSFELSADNLDTENCSGIVVKVQ